MGLVAGAALLAGWGTAAAAEGETVRRTVFDIMYVATFGKDQFNLIGFMDMMVIYLCSIASVALIIEHAITIRRTVIVPELSVAQVKTMFDERRFREALEFCQTDPSFVSGVIHAGLIEAANGYEAMENAMQEAADERSARLYRKIEWLNLLGNIAPMLGLLGTVWGMIMAFGEIEAKGGKANPSDLAGGILVALFSTFMGLVVAIPALAGYGIFRSRVEQMSMEASLVAEELLANFKPSGG
jgi:biopolymer transport protein ExbB